MATTPVPGSAETGAALSDSGVRRVDTLQDADYAQYFRNRGRGAAPFGKTCRAVTSDDSGDQWHSNDNEFYVGVPLTGPGGHEVGELKASLSAVEQGGWKRCNSQAISRTIYAALFALIGTTYGVGDGSTTFNLPESQDATFIGIGPTGLLTGLGFTGANTANIQHSHGHSHADGTLAAASHQHSDGSLSAANHQHTYNGTTNDESDAGDAAGTTTNFARAPHNHSYSGTTDNQNADVSGTTGSSGADVTGSTATDSTTGGPASQSIVQRSLGVYVKIFTGIA